MSEHWSFPAEELLRYTGPEWLLHMIDISDTAVGAHLVLLLWRTWYVRDRWTHEGKWLNTASSINFLLSYWDSLCSSTAKLPPDVKGKQALDSGSRREVVADALCRIWGKCLAFVPSPDSLHLSFHFYIIVLLHFLIYTNTPPQDGLKISNMPILLQLNSFSLGPKPFVKQSAS